MKIISIENNSWDYVQRLIEREINSAFRLKENNMVHKYNFENATEKRLADKELGHVLMPHPDGQVKHPEHLQQHEMLQVLQRQAISGNWSIVKKTISELPEHQKKDTITMLKRSMDVSRHTWPDDIV